MFTETTKQQGTENPLKGFLKKDKLKYQPVLLFFSIFVLATLFVGTFMGHATFSSAQYIISFFFLADFAYRFYLAENKLIFFKSSWIDLALCIPFYPPAWLVVTTTLRSIKVILEYVLAEINSAFKSMLAIGAALVTFATISILQFEVLPECNIKTAWDAMWWSVCTITTVGYGDKFPMTAGGKIVAVVLMVSGIGLFGTLIGYVSTFFTDKEKKNNDTVDTIEELSQQIKQLQQTIENKKS